jgi:hypothetical protein
VVVVRTVFATLAGIGQLGGLALMAEGLFLPSPSNASGSNPYDSNRGETAHNVQQLRLDSKPSPQWFFSPVASESSFGLSVAGQF